MRKATAGQRGRRCVSGLLLALLGTVLPGPADGHDPQELIPEQVKVTERLDAVVPRELGFTDQEGKQVRLGEYFTGVPVVLSLNYYSCPTLCPLVFRNLVATLKGMPDLALGRDFRIVTVSIDAGETLALARAKARETYALLGPAPLPQRNWPFLFGAASRPLAESVGVSYLELKPHDFAHPNVMVVLAPDGRISRYLYGVEIAPRDLKLALLEAAQGKIGSAPLLNRAFLYCFHYDPVAKRYVLLASRIMTGAMVAVFLVAAGMLAVLWRLERKRP